jgi:hypothetical protein
MLSANEKSRSGHSSQGYQPLGSADSKPFQSKYKISNAGRGGQWSYLDVDVEESENPKLANFHRSQVEELCDRMKGTFDSVDWQSWQAHDTALETRTRALVQAHSNDPNAHTTIAFDEHKVGGFSGYYADPESSVQVTITSTDGKVSHRSVGKWTKEEVLRPADKVLGKCIDAGDGFLFPTGKRGCSRQ